MRSVQHIERVKRQFLAVSQQKGNEINIETRRAGGEPARRNTRVPSYTVPRICKK